MEPALDIAQSAASTDPDVGLRAVASLRALTERLEIVQVENARKLGWSWQDIAGRLRHTAPRQRPPAAVTLKIEDRYLLPAQRRDIRKILRSGLSNSRKLS